MGSENRNESVASPIIHLRTQPNEARCKETVVSHRADIPHCCPVSGNPQPSSSVEIEYAPEDSMIEVESLRKYIDSYVGGRGEVRSMEGMIQSICQDCADCVAVPVCVKATLVLEPEQMMTVRCRAIPMPAPPVTKSQLQQQVTQQAVTISTLIEGLQDQIKHCSNGGTHISAVKALAGVHAEGKKPA